MRKFLLSSLAFVALGATAATAADLARKAPVYKAPPPPIVDLWTGFYVGASIGYGWGGWDAYSNQRVFNFESNTASPNVRGVTAGIQAGYNWRFAPQWLVGIEAEIVDPLKAGQSWNDPGLPPPCIDCDDFVPRAGGPASLTHEWKLRWFGTVRARLGVLPVENWLLYATGGLAYGESSYEFHFSQPGAAPAPSYYALTTRPSHVGYTVGAGAETKLGANWSVKLEYLYLDLGKAYVDTLDIDGFPFHVDYRLRSHIARIGVNYKFDWGKGVVAKY